MLCKRGLSRHAVSVCPSRSCIVSKRITYLQHFFTVGQPHHSSYSIPNSMAIFRWEPPSQGIECMWGRIKSRNQQLSGLAINNCCTVVCILDFAAGFLFTAGVGRPSAINALLCTVRDRPSAVSCYTQSQGTWVVCTTARLHITLKITEQNRIVHTCKSEAEVTNNKKCARGIVLLKLTTDRHKASHGNFATAELLVSLLLARLHLTKITEFY